MNWFPAKQRSLLANRNLNESSSGSQGQLARPKVFTAVERWRRQRHIRKNRAKLPKSLAGTSRARAIAPHCLFFTLYTALYFVPLWLVSISGYGEGMVSETGSDAGTIMTRIIVVYLIGVTSFWIGSWSTPKFAWLLGQKTYKPVEIAKIHIYQIDKIILGGLICAFLISKLMLIPTGAYSTYAFGSSMMETSAWTTSMFFSETLAFAALIALFSDLRHNVMAFVFLSALNGINLLHGTRNFFVTAMTGALLYLYVRKRVSLLRMFLYGLSSACAAVLLGYIVYLTRAHAAWSDFSVLAVLSPITFESVFSQISLINVLGHPELFEHFGHIGHFIADVFVFTSPRLLVGDKEALLWSNNFSSFSPLGAFNGFAMGLLYFGYLLPLAYFLLGLASGALRRFANTSYGAALYVYFCCDFVYRVQRDGYVIPAKMMINNVEILCLLGILHLWRRRGSLRGNPLRIAAKSANSIDKAYSA